MMRENTSTRLPLRANQRSRTLSQKLRFLRHLPPGHPLAEVSGFHRATILRAPIVKPRVMVYLYSMGGLEAL